MWLAEILLRWRLRALADRPRLLWVADLCWPGVLLLKTSSLNLGLELPALWVDTRARGVEESAREEAASSAAELFAARYHITAAIAHIFLRALLAAKIAHTS